MHVERRTDATYAIATAGAGIVRCRFAEKPQTHIRLHGGHRLHVHVCELLGFRVLQLLRSGHVSRLRADDRGDSADRAGLQRDLAAVQNGGRRTDLQHGRYQQARRIPRIMADHGGMDLGTARRGDGHRHIHQQTVQPQPDLSGDGRYRCGHPAARIHHEPAGHSSS